MGTSALVTPPGDAEECSEGRSHNALIDGAALEVADRTNDDKNQVRSSRYRSRLAREGDQVRRLGRWQQLLVAALAEQEITVVQAVVEASPGPGGNASRVKLGSAGRASAGRPRRRHHQPRHRTGRNPAIPPGRLKAS